MKEPVLLVLNSHASHIRYASKIIAEIVEILWYHFHLALHTSFNHSKRHVTGLLRWHLTGIDLYLKTRGHDRMNHVELAKLLNKASVKTATIQEATSGFGTSSVWPVSPEMFTEVGFELAQHTSGVDLQITTDYREDPAGVGVNF